MYGLSPEVARPGCAFRELLAIGRRLEAFRETSIGIARSERVHRRGQGVHRRSGDRRCASIRIVNQPLTGGGWVATHEDITEQQRAEKERDRTREFFDQIIDHVPVSIVVKDASDRRIVLSIAPRRRFRGRSRADALGKTVYDLFPQVRADQIAVQDEKLQKSEFPCFSMGIRIWRVPMIRASSPPRGSSFAAMTGSRNICQPVVEIGPTGSLRNKGARPEPGVPGPGVRR